MIITPKWITESRLLFKIAIPILFSHIFVILIEVTDSIMASWMGPISLASISVSHSILYPLLMGVIGLTMVLSPIVAHHRSREEFETGNYAMTAMIAIAIGCSLVMIAWVLIALALLPYIGITPVIIPLVKSYMVGRLWGLIPFSLYLVFRFYFEGRGRTMPILMTTMIAFGLNIILNYVLMNGVWIFPEMGIKGIGISTSIVETIQCIVLGIFWYRAYFKRYFKKAHLVLPKFKMITRLLKLGLPSGIALAGEVGMFAILGVVLARISPMSVASHQIAINVSSLAFIIPMSMAGAMATRVGYLNATKDKAPAVRLTITLGLGLVVTVMTLISIGVWTYASAIAHLYSDNPTIHASAITLIGIVAIFQLFDGIQATCNGILKGFHDTIIPMWMTIISYWIVGLGSGMVLSQWTATPEKGFWIGILFGLMTSSLLLGMRVYNKLRCQSTHL